MKIGFLLPSLFYNVVYSSPVYNGRTDHNRQLSGACIGNFDIQINGCDYKSILDALETEIPSSCSHDANTELQIITGTKTNNDAEEYVSEMCSNAWENTVDATTYEDIKLSFNDDFMNKYADGKGFLNTETGNFQGEQSTKYPTTKRSMKAGKKIDAYYHATSYGATNSRLQATFENVQNCELQSIMCCFGRDRQSEDNNGNCKLNQCGENADPADNSNLCWTEPSMTTFPNHEEGHTHCHGFAWAEDENDFISQLKYNNFFYVSMYDHLYTRGYVQNQVVHKNGNSKDYVPMCSCIENMPPVSRSDCTQMDVTLTFRLSVDPEYGVLKVESLNDLDIDFNACQGYDYNDPTRNENNDLASYAVRLVAEGKMSTTTQYGMYETLLGYKYPNTNNNERVCKQAYEELMGEPYPRWCCTHDYKTCHTQSFCNRDQSACRQQCKGEWIRDDWCPADGIPKYGECTNNVDGCCSPATCQGDAYYKQCL